MRSRLILAAFNLEEEKEGGVEILSTDECGENEQEIIVSILSATVERSHEGKFDRCSIALLEASSFFFEVKAEDDGTLRRLVRLAF